MTDPVLDRITYDPGGEASRTLAAIPWPDGMAPQPAQAYDQAPLPPADAVVITWTAAEGRALADVLTPGVPLTSWARYTTGWQSFAPQLTERSPAREAGYLAQWCALKIGSVRVVALKSALHPATDGPTIPAAQLACQVANETGACLVITTGTAGGAGDGTVLGDINVATQTGADFTTRLKASPLAGKFFPCTPLSAAQQAALEPATLGPLLEPNASRLPAQWATRPPQIWHGTTVSTDFFAYATVTDEPYHVEAFAGGAARAVEMDDAPVVSALAGHGVSVLSVRNASDPVMPGTDHESESKTAEKIYQQYGYFTSAGSAVTCVALIAATVERV